MTRDVTPNFKPPRPLRGWRGLRQRSAKKILADRALGEARREVRARSGGWCEVVGCARRARDVHHVIPRAGGKPDHSPDNLLDLCPEHHDRAHHDPTWARAQNLKRRRPLYPRVLP